MLALIDALLKDEGDTMRIPAMLGTLLVAIATGGLALPLPSLGQAYPVKPVRLLVGASPGGPLDLVARQIAPKINEALGQPIVVENRPGAGGTIAAEYVSKAAPDGYTLFLGSASTFSIAPHLYPKLGYDTLRDFAPVSTVTEVPHVLVIHPSLPVKSVRDFIALAKARPGQLHFGSGGNGTFTSLAAALFNTMAGIQAVHVPYKGTGPAVIDLLAGQIQFIVNSISTSAPHIRSGKLRALAVSGRTRSALLPELQTISAAGLPGYEASTWFGVVAPAATPRDVIAKLNGVIVKAVADTAVKERFFAQGLDPFGTSPEAFAKLLRDELPKWEKVVKTAGAKLD